MEGHLPPTAANGHRIRAISALSASYQNGQHMFSQRLENRGFRTYRHGNHRRHGHGSRHNGRHRHHRRTEPSRPSEDQCAASPPGGHQRGHEPA